MHCVYLFIEIQQIRNNYQGDHLIHPSSIPVRDLAHSEHSRRHSLQNSRKFSSDKTHDKKFNFMNLLNILSKYVKF